MFKLNMNADADGTSSSGYVKIAPADLIRAFGKPRVCDSYKVSGEYIFTDEAGNVFTVYDWKHTTLYCGDNCDDAPTPKEFWGLDEPYDFYIGSARGDWEEFRQWLLTKVAQARQSEPKSAFTVLNEAIEKAAAAHENRVVVFLDDNTYAEMSGDVRVVFAQDTEEFAAYLDNDPRLKRIKEDCPETRFTHLSLSRLVLLATTGLQELGYLRGRVPGPTAEDIVVTE
jgi:hypothetical protein